MTFCTDIHGSQRTNPDDFYDPFIFPLKGLSDPLRLFVLCSPTARAPLCSAQWKTVVAIGNNGLQSAVVPLSYCVGQALNTTMKQNKIHSLSTHPHLSGKKGEVFST